MSGDAGGAVGSSLPGLYTSQDALTDPGAHADLYDDLPADPAALRDIVSRLIVHVSWTELYGISSGVPLSRDTRKVADRLTQIRASSRGSLAADRAPTERTSGTCRDYALLLCSMLRHRSFAARVRCGFATYFVPEAYEDHWICEYWSEGGGRWVRADAQLDARLEAHLGIDFDCADLPDGAFVTGGRAWTLARTGAEAPGDFGHGDAKGLWFLQVDLHRDALALTNRHLSAWDSWRSATVESKSLSGAEIADCDRLARAVEAADRSADGMVELQSHVARIQSPPWHR